MSAKLQELERLISYGYPTRQEFEALVKVAKAACGLNNTAPEFRTRDQYEQLAAELDALEALMKR